MKDDQLFQQLKKEIVAAMQQSYPGMSGDITEWKGREITDFQDELTRRVNAHISEKWFYTHMKAQYPTLPRIDILDFLSRFAGYRNWDDFKHAKNNKSGKTNRLLTPGKYFILIPLLTILIAVAFYFAYTGFSTTEYQFCFYDAETGERIHNTLIEVRFINNDEFPEPLFSQGNGCLSIETSQNIVTFAVKAPYYLSDTISRNLETGGAEKKVMLQANTYARLIQHFSGNSIGDWQEKKDRLDRIISDDALIYLEKEDGLGSLEIFTKKDFIDMLLFTPDSENKIRILETKLRKKKIILLRFKFIKG